MQTGQERTLVDQKKSELIKQKLVNRVERQLKKFFFAWREVGVGKVRREEKKRRSFRIREKSGWFKKS